MILDSFIANLIILDAIYDSWLSVFKINGGSHFEKRLPRDGAI